LTIKKDFYERVGISEYWVIQDIRNVTVYTLINGKYIPQEFSLKEGSEGVLEVSSKLFNDLVIKFDKKYIYKFK
jgi:Uma2 family endonuclease